MKKRFSVSTLMDPSISECQMITKLLVCLLDYQNRIKTLLILGLHVTLGCHESSDVGSKGLRGKLVIF